VHAESVHRPVECILAHDGYDIGTELGRDGVDPHLQRSHHEHQDGKRHDADRDRERGEGMAPGMPAKALGEVDRELRAPDRQSNQHGRASGSAMAPSTSSRRREAWRSRSRLWVAMRMVMPSWWRRPKTSMT